MENDYSTLQPLYSPDGKTLLKVPQSVEEFIVPEGVTTIGVEAFYICDKLKKVQLPSTLVEIRERAFLGCDSLVEIDLPASLQTIQCGAFSVTGITKPIIHNNKFIYLPESYEGSYAIPDGVTEINMGAFISCDGLTHLRIPNSVKKIGDFSFAGCGLKSAVIRNNVFYYLPKDYEGKYTIPDGITTIKGGAFHECRKLTELIIPESVSYIGDGAFCYCSNLFSIEFSQNISHIGSSAFFGCDHLKEITLPSHLTSLSAYMFARCKKLTSIDIPESVVELGESLFGGCTEMVHVSLPPSLKRIGEGVFHECRSLKTIDLPDSVEEIGANAFLWTAIENPIIHHNRFHYLPYQWKGEYHIPEGVTEIADGAFYGCLYLKSVVIPESVNRIGAEAFSHCLELESVNIPRSLKSIGAYAFKGCKQLGTLVIPDGIANIGEHAFDTEIPEDTDSLLSTWE